MSSKKRNVKDPACQNQVLEAFDECLRRSNGDAHLIRLNDGANFCNETELKPADE